METAEIKAYHEIYRKELFDYVVPFWLSHSPDREYGGYLTLLERDGTVFDTDKYAWMQGREIWMFSKLCSVYGTRPEWVDAAGLGVAFMRAHGRAENGDFYFAMDRKGNALNPSLQHLFRLLYVHGAGRVFARHRRRTGAYRGAGDLPPHPAAQGSSQGDMDQGRSGGAQPGARWRCP